jgi:dTDP-4-dehydrorhamnose 3,5-epimerase
VDVPVHADNRGWFKENWQREKMTALGLPDFGPVQHNVSFNQTAGTTRGIHAEPWDKLVSVLTGRIFGAWVDLREGATFGAVFTTEIDESRAVFVPRGVGNAYQTLVDTTTYSYLVNAHWRADAEYPALNLADETVAIAWPIPLRSAEISAKDEGHPRLGELRPMGPRKTLILGAGGQLGRALRDIFPVAEAFTRAELDINDSAALWAMPWAEYGTIINAAAYTAVDEAETEQGRRDAWATNVTAVADLARIAHRFGLTLVTVSSDYVFDGVLDIHAEDEPVSPLGVYGQTKAAGDAITSTVAKHYIVRTSWVVGTGRNFIATMEELAEKGVSPSVVNDQTGILTPATDLAAGIKALLDTHARYGIHHVTGNGPPQSWADIAREVFVRKGRDPRDVIGVTTRDYAAGKQLAPRPRHGTLRSARDDG